MRRARLRLPQRQNYLRSCPVLTRPTLREQAPAFCLDTTQVSWHSTIVLGNLGARSASEYPNSGRRVNLRTFASIAPRTHPTSVSNKEDDGQEDSSATRTRASSIDKLKRLIPLSRRERKDIALWLKLLDRYLPAELRADPDAAYRSDRTKAIRSDVPQILNTARKHWNTGQDLLAHMMINGRSKAAFHIVSALLQRTIPLSPSEAQMKMPSNVNWPSDSLTWLCGRPIELPSISSTLGVTSCRPEELKQDPRYASHTPGDTTTAMECVWFSLGTAITECVDLPEIQATQILCDVQQILGIVHNLDLVPKNVYDYHLSPYNATVQKPPILHLVSSRILTALSDAVWRKQQDEVIEQAASHGISYRDIGKDPPGGRFRLKVRPLPAEVWLEFVLWCCVEGGFVSVGARLIERLRQRHEPPWFAVTWSPRGGDSQTSPAVHWDRVKARHGGAVGLIEGYSREEPFVQVPPLTISTEVVLALTDANVDCVSCGDPQRGLRVGAVMADIVEMVTFLEPHDLPIGYFDCLAVRLLQSNAVGTSHDTTTMYDWYQKLAFMKSLEQARPSQASRISYDLGSLASHSELFAGILHQALETFVQAGDVHRALESFNALQELVDQSKLQAIDVFLHENTPLVSAESAEEGVADGSHLARQDFVASHGQLPLHKLAGLLDLTTDTTLVGFGQWLLYNSDPDGPLIPSRAYTHPAIGRVLLRFGIGSGDRALVSNTQAALVSGYLKPSVRVLRARVNTFVHLSEFDTARQDLRTLRNSKGGGAGLGNFAYVAATLIRLEHTAHVETPEHQPKIQACIKLLEDMLEGKYQNRGGDFFRRIDSQFKQQMAALLRIFQFNSESLLARVTARYKSKFKAGNSPHLVPTVFNILLQAIVETKGAVEGVRFWDEFCTVPNDENRLPENEALTETDVDDDGGGGGDTTQALEDDYQPSSTTSTGGDVFSDPTDSDPFLPLVNSHKSLWLSEGQDTSNVVDIEESNDDELHPPMADISLPASTIEDFKRSARTLIPLAPPATEDLDDQEEPRGAAVVMANIRSLQIIVRCAVQEWHLPPGVRRPHAGASGLDILGWAARRFESLGAPAGLAYVEVRRPLDRSDIKQQLESQMESFNVVSRTLSGTNKAPSRRVETRSDVQEMFVGRERTRATRDESKPPQPSRKLDEVMVTSWRRLQR